MVAFEKLRGGDGAWGFDIDNRSFALRPVRSSRSIRGSKLIMLVNVCRISALLVSNYSVGK